MDPYFTTDSGELYKGDSMEILPEIDSESVELIFVDPPYNIEKAEWDKFETQEEYLNWVVKWVKMSGDVLTEDGSMYLMGFPEILADIKYRIERECEWIDSIRWLSWHYRNKPQMADGGWTRSQEGILWIRKSDNYDFNMDRVRIPYNKHTKKYPDRKQGQTSLFGSEDGFEWDPNVKGAKPRDVIDVPTVNNASKERTEHPTQKPEELLRKIVWASSNKDDTVLDPFGGSGTTFAVCEQLGRNWVGIEKEEQYCEMTQDRVENIEEKKSPQYWMKHDLDRIEHRRKVRYGN